MEIRPVFIIGTGHSGTTILYKMLAKHPDFAWFSQYSCRGGEIPNRFRVPFYNRLSRLLRFTFRAGWAKGEGRFSIIPRPGDAEQIWDWIFSGETVSRLRKILEMERRQWQKNYILLKNIRFHCHIPLLAEAFPQAKFIHIVRDGRAIVLSRKYKIGEKGEDRTKENIENFFPKTREWVKVLDGINAQKEKIDMLELKYEDFCGDTHAYLKKVLNYAGLAIEKFPFDEFPKTLVSMNSKWFEIASNEEVAKIENIQKEMLKKYGYIHPVK